MSGAAESVANAFEIVRPGGRVILFGIPARPVEIDVADKLIFKNLEVSAVSGRQVWDTWFKTRWLLEHNVVDLRPLITDQMPLGDFERAFDLLESGEACKLILCPVPHERRVAPREELVWAEP
jgi:threonine 3-dehydrogenase